MEDHMAKLIQIDPSMPISFTPHRNERITDAVMVDLAEQMNLPNLLLCDTPLADTEPLELRNEAAAVLHWAQNHEKWCARLEETLQSMSQDLEGRPFLTAFMPIGELEALAKDLADSGLAPQLLHLTKQWQAQGATMGYIDGYRLQKG